MHDARIRVYRLPEKLTNGFCFAGGNPIAFLNVDWFHAPDASQNFSRDDLTAFLTSKGYYDPSARFLVLDDRPGETFILEPRTPPSDTQVGTSNASEPKNIPANGDSQ